MESERVECSCWENQVLRLVPGLEIHSAWFGHPDDEKRRQEVSEQLRGKEWVHASVQTFGDPAVGSRKKLWAQCSYRWLEEEEELIFTQLAEKAARYLDARDAEDLQKLWAALPDLTPSDPSASVWEQQMEILAQHLSSPLAVQGLLYLSECRRRVFVSAACSLARGFPFAFCAARAAQSLARALRAAEFSAPDGLTDAMASREEVRHYLKRCRQGSHVFERLFGDFFHHVHAEWQKAAAGAQPDYLQQLIQAAHEAVLEVLSLPEEEVRQEEELRMEALLAAEDLAFCTLCLRPLQQFPDEVGALVDSKGRRLEGTLYHRRCAFSVEGSDSETLAAFSRRPRPLLMHRMPPPKAQGWWPLPCLTRAADWAKFVAAGAAFGGSEGAAVPLEHVAVALAAALPVHPQHALAQLSRNFGRRLGRGELSSMVEDLGTLELIASWASAPAASLIAPWLPREELLAESNLSSWAKWFRAWDATEAQLSCGRLALALGSAVRAAADRQGEALEDPFAEVLALLCATGEASVSSSRFVCEVAASASMILRTRSAPDRPADTPPPELSKEPAEVKVRLTFIGLCGRRRFVFLDPELRVSLRDLLSGLAADSVGFSLAQEASGLRFFFAGRELPQEPSSLRELGIFGDSAVLVLQRSHPEDSDEGVAHTPQEQLLLQLSRCWVLGLLFLSLASLWTQLSPSIA